MKIYANNNELSILQFLGTDLWVRCTVKGYLDEAYYVRPQRFIHENFGMCYIFPAHWADEYTYYAMPELTADYIEDWISFARPFHFSDITVLEPLDALTNDELIEMMSA